MRRHLAYLKYVLRHKWYVLLAGLKLGVPLWMLIFHDWDKFLPDEWFPYARYFYLPDGRSRYEAAKENGYYKPTTTDDESFDFAWLLHQKRNKHHWQWWMLPEDNGGMKILPMPDLYRREMLADWRGAGKAQGYGDNTHQWYLSNKEKMSLHPDTQRWIEEQLGL